MSTAFPSDVQRLLSEAAQAVTRSDWAIVRARALDILALAPGHIGANALLAAADRVLAGRVEVGSRGVSVPGNEGRSGSARLRASDPSMSVAFPFEPLPNLDFRRLAALRGDLERLERLDRINRVNQGAPAITDGLTLDPVRANEPMGVVFALPSSGALSLVDRPDWLSFSTDISGIQRLLLLNGTVAPDARTFTFIVRVGALSFRLNQPVWLGIHNAEFSSRGRIRIPAVPGESIDLVFTASGEPGPVEWRLSGDPPSALSWELSNSLGRARVVGQVAEQARSCAMTLEVRQNGQRVTRQIEFSVRLRLISSMPRLEAEKRRPVRVDLPQVTGGDGTTYEWRARTLPLGLQLVHDDASNLSTGWTVQGTIADSVYPAEGRVLLEVHSPLTEPVRVWLDYHVRPTRIHQFNVWTQNTLLRPTHLPLLVRAAGGALGALVGATVPGVGILAGALGGLFGSEAVSDEYALQNTDADNSERTEMIVRQVRSLSTPPAAGGPSFDIVALQEVFTGDALTALARGTRETHAALPGPASGSAAGDVLEALSIGTAGSLPAVGLHAAGSAGVLNIIGSSGLLLLVRQALHVVEHLQHTFDNAGGVFDSTMDWWANKGFTLTKIEVGHLAGPTYEPDGTEFFWVVNTHTHASNPQARAAQLEELRAVLEARRDHDHPVLFMGDFNINDLSMLGSEYRSMRRILDIDDDVLEDTGSGPHPTVDPRNAYAHNWFGTSAPARLDYLLIRQGRRYQLEYEATFVIDDHRETELFRDENWAANRGHASCYLSDHWGLRATLRLVRG
jgi:hypothetical protein